MLQDAQKVLEMLFSSEHIEGKPFFNPKTKNWHVKIPKLGVIIRTKDLIEIQEYIDILNGEDIE